MAPMDSEPRRFDSPAPSAPDQKAVMGIGRNGAAQRPGDFDLHRRIHHMVLAADHMGDAELDVIDDRRQRVEIAAILADQHRIGQGRRIDMLGPADKIGPFHRARDQA